MPIPQILPDSKWGKWLPDGVLSQSDPALKVWRAEQMVIRRYREHEHASTNAVREDTHDAWVQLIGWEETDDGDPDVAAMPDDLVTALRDTISRIVTHRYEAPDDNVQSRSVGSRSVSFRADAGALPRSVYEPLRPFDDRTPYSPGV
jgi:hypothetical protein